VFIDSNFFLIENRKWLKLAPAAKIKVAQKIISLAGDI